jgi:hypothetical protein
MNSYTFSPDDKLHTRYSELVKCTPGQIQRVIDERNGRVRVETEEMLFGTARHELWEKESRKTKLSPKCFGHQVPATFIETEFVTEILPGVVVHSRPDLVSIPKQMIIDYKTLKAGSPLKRDWMDKAWKEYSNRNQLAFYAYQLGINDLRIKKLRYSVEVWNTDQTKILDYINYDQDIGLNEISKIIPWVKDRVAMLKGALKEAEKQTA